MPIESFRLSSQKQKQFGFILATELMTMLFAYILATTNGI
jgi:hypothetical protein